MTREKPRTTARSEVTISPIIPSQADEAELVQRASQGDRDALAILYESHVDRVYRHLYSKVGNIAEAEDLTSETFTRAIEGIMRGQYVWRDKPFAAWLFAIVRHVLQERRRKLNGLPLIENLDTLLESFEPMSLEMDIPDALVQKEEQMALWDLVKKLPFYDQKLLIMRHAYCLPFSEIARHLGRSEAACKQLHYRVIAKLKRLVQNTGSILE